VPLVLTEPRFLGNFKVDRKHALAETVGTNGRVRAIGYVLTFGIELFKAADEAELEGIVARRAYSPYRRGRSNDGIKIKTTHGRAIDAERAKWNES
jgi:ATP-dependent DNA ligase